MARAPWKGNVRELENTIESLVVMTEGRRIRLEDLPPSLRAAGIRLEAGPGDTASLKLAEVEREHILRVLEAEGGNRTNSARVLGISLRGLRYKLKDYAERGFLKTAGS